MSFTSDEREQFISDGYIVVKSAFDPNHPVISKWIHEVWERCNLREDKPDEWPEKVHLPSEDDLPYREVAPEALEKVLAVLGGEERTQGELMMHNGFVCNFALGRDEEWKNLEETGGWHADGDFFRHFLDSREQSCLIGCYFTDVEHQGGATLISPGSHQVVARFLAEHPEGVMPSFVGDHQLMEKCDRFLELTATAGDVAIMHPLMLHASSQNKRNKVRLMNNNNVHLKEHFCFSRRDGNYSLVEEATLAALGKDNFDFKITAEREAIVPSRLKMQKEFAEKVAKEKSNKPS